ncbi:MAG TPA: hypothetical protein DEB17_09540 [Chlorobaculum sp.]|uniref:Uncharacterized protein n=1 Tax=Chlorobaculum tepidum (strain ATCC 49652 / DSM 12025 / NBRC 103806 / TLS) TaxID=194439 RepID=Q8KBF1_CHLTE|nr:hypothetical protein CT1836 [Chlorobaculum tepidum TLS]HBU24210.1 hypothetical protein [Chlorobaculum sp.]
MYFSFHDSIVYCWIQASSAFRKVCKKLAPANSALRPTWGEGRKQQAIKAG